MAITNAEAEQFPNIKTRDRTFGARRTWSFICAAWQVSRDVDINFCSEDPETQARLKASVIELFDQEHTEPR